MITRLEPFGEARIVEHDGWREQIVGSTLRSVVS
jgi:hypothetical protein